MDPRRAVEILREGAHVVAATSFRDARQAEELGALAIEALEAEFAKDSHRTDATINAKLAYLAAAHPEGKT